LGGGSVIDAGKAIAALVPNPEDVLAYLEVIGAGQPLTHPPLPFIAVPTTAGTGAEVTRNAVLGAPEQGVKVSLRSPLMLPKLAVIDPELALTVPPAVTAATGLDALTQLIEPWVSPRANPLTDALCLDGIRRVATACRARSIIPGTSPRGRTWRWRRCTAVSRWPMPVLGRCMDSRRRWAGSSTRRTGRSARRFCRT
jgi:alcohol dehydrogenase class IV